MFIMDAFIFLVWINVVPLVFHVVETKRAQKISQRGVFCNLQEYSFQKNEQFAEFLISFPAVKLLFVMQFRLLCLPLDFRLWGGNGGKHTELQLNSKDN